MKKRTVLLLFIGLLIVGIIATIVLLYKNNIMKKNSKEENKPVEVEKIEDFAYVLEDRDKAIYKEKYNELKKVLSNADNIDFEKYAGLLSELYIIDLYTIENKVTKYDVGGTEFVWPDKKENFELKARDTIYKYVEDNSTKKRTQSLPVVTATTVESTKEIEYKLGEEKMSGYEVKISWEYEKDLGYDKSATIKLVKKDQLLYIVEQKK